MKTRTGPEEALRCSFCHKSQDAVAKVISSPSDYPRAYICDECVAVCNSILEDDVFDILAHVAGLSKRGGVDNGEGYVEHLGQSVCQQRFAGAGEADEQDVGLGELNLA